MEKVQQPGDSQCYTSSPEHFRSHKFRINFRKTWHVSALPVAGHNGAYDPLLSHAVKKWVINYSGVTVNWEKPTIWAYISLCRASIYLPPEKVLGHYVSCDVRTEFIYDMYKKVDRLCGLVVIVPGYRSRGPGSIPCTTRFSEKYWAWNGVHSALWVQLRSYLEEKVAAPV
jgi:hypothetical protein